MSPRHIDPNVDYKKLHQLSEEFSQAWMRLHALYFDAVAGFTFVRSKIESDQARARNYVQGTELDTEEFQDKRIFAYSMIFSEDFATSAIQDATLGEARARNAPSGANFTTLGQLCVVSFYDFWDTYLRREYVIAKGHLDRNEKDIEVEKERLREHASYDLWGDLRILRISIVHNLGVATADVTKCKILKWFKPDDPIFLSPAHMREIFLALLDYRNQLFREQFPKQYIQL